MQGVKKLPGEDIVNYEIHVKKYREVERYDELTSEQSRELFVILTPGDQKCMDKCLKQVTSRMARLTSAILQAVWQETHTTTLHAPDSMSQVNSDSMQQKKTNMGQIDQKGKKQPPNKCKTCGKMQRDSAKKQSGFQNTSSTTTRT